MPRYVTQDSEDDFEPKTATRKTRTALAASVVDSPVRRSTRIRHGSVNPDGSSPESVTSSTSSQVTRTTRRRAAENAAATVEPLRSTRTRKNSNPSTIVEQPEFETASDMPSKGRTSKQNSVNNSPETPKPITTRTRRSVRASSETKSPPPPPVSRVTRRTRASSIEPEPIERVSRTAAVAPATPTRRRRTQVSVLPSEPVLTEDANEDKIDVKNDEASITLEEKLTPSVKKSSPEEDDSSNVEMEIDRSYGTNPSSPNNKSTSENLRELEQLKPSRKSVSNDRSPSYGNLDNSMKQAQIVLVKPKRDSLDKSKDLGMKIEDLLNKSTEDLEESPRDKENQKLNISPDKPRKSLEITVSNVNIIRGKSLGSTQFVNKSDKKWVNTSLDEQVLSNKVSKLTGKEEMRTSPNFRDLNSEKKKQRESLTGVGKSPEKSLNDSLTKKQASKPAEEEVEETEKTGSPRMKTDLIKLDETSIDNEIIEEFKLYDSESSKSDTSKPRLDLTVENLDDEAGSDSSDNIFDKPRAVKAYGDEGLRRMSLTLERISPHRLSGAKTSPQKSPKVEENEDSEIAKDEEKGSPKKKKIEDENGESRTSLTSENNKKPKSSSIETLSDRNSKREAAEEKSLDADDEGEETETFSTDKNSPRVAVEKTEKTPKTDHSNQISDSDSSMTIDRLFHDISAEEWNKKRKSQNAEENRKSVEVKAKLQTVESDVESEEDIELVKKKSWKENDEEEDPGNNSTDSIETITLKPKVSAKMSDQVERKSLGKTITEEKEDESEDEEMPQDVPGNRKSLNKSVSIADEASDQSNEAEAQIPVTATSQEEEEEEEEEEEMEVDANLSEASTIPTGLTDQYSEISKEGRERKDVVEPEASPKKTPKSVKKKSPKKSLNKSKDVYEFTEFSGSEEDEGKTCLVTPEEKLLRNRTPKEPLSRNYSIVAVADSDSGSEENFSEKDSEDSNQGVPGFLFNVKSSGDEDVDDDEEQPEKSSNTIDSDIAREMNLAGDDELEYSDDEVQGDECRASESEHSNEEDEGSDLEDFVVADDAVESSEYSDDQDKEKEEEEETPTKSKYRRILDKSSSEEEEGELEKSVEENGDEEKEKKEEDEEAVKSAEKVRRRSNSLAAESTKSESVTKRLSKSAERGKTLSDKKVKKFDLEETEAAASPEIELSKSGKKLKKFSGLIATALDTTVDLCTPEEHEKEESGLEENTSSLSLDVSNASTRRKSLKKLRKKLSDDPEGYTPDKTEVKKEGDDLMTSEAETPIRLSKGSKEKTPKSLKKNHRDSMQIIAECGQSTPTISDLNKTMLTPNSETPITKFLKKERLNESLPLLKLTKKSKRLSGSPAMSKMIEDQPEEDISETDEQEEVSEDLADAEGNDTSEEVEENGEGLNGVEETSEGDESRDVDENGDEDEDENENDENEAEIDSGEEVEEEDEEDEESEGEQLIDIKKKKTKDTPEVIKVLEKHETSSKKRSRTETEADSFAQVKISTTPKNRGRRNEENEEERTSVISSKKRLLSSSTLEKVEKKKRARLESVDTPQSTKEKKKPKIMAEDEESDSDEAPESLGFSESRGTALQAMKDVASSIKAAKEAKKKKRKEHQARIREEREAKLASLNSQGKKERSLKRLPEDFLENLSDVAQRPKKKLKMAKKEEQIVPSKSSFEPGKPTKSIVIEERSSPLSTAGGTTQFSVINLQKTKKKQAKNAATVASFRERMLARNPRQPVSAYLVYQAKQKASGLNALYRK